MKTVVPTVAKRFMKAAAIHSNSLDDPIHASISARDGGTAPVRVQVIADAFTAYVTASSSSTSSSGRMESNSSASRSTSAASSAAPKLSPAPTVSTTVTGTAGTRA
jgi:hypothetical protein